MISDVHTSIRMFFREQFETDHLKANFRVRILAPQCAHVKHYYHASAHPVTFKANAARIEVHRVQ